MANVQDNKALLNWEDYRLSLIKSTPVPKETSKEKKSRIKELEKDPEEWFKYYFTKYCFAEAAFFHKKATKRLFANSTWYEVRAWSREMAKDARTMMEILYAALTGKIHNVVFMSWSFDNAVKLLMPYMINLESNPRIISDYGRQKGFKNWQTKAFTTTSGVSFYAFGAGQSPRGTRNEEIRPDCLIFSDYDNDEVCRNPERLKEYWNFAEEAVIPTVSISKNKWIIWLGNIIAKDSCIVRAGKVADCYDIVNIRDKDNKSMWPEKNSEEQIDWLLSKISYNAAQQEYFNNPISEGTVFKEITWGKVPPLNQFRFLVLYGDPAPSNSENKKSSYKSSVLMGMIDGIYYVINCFLLQTTNTAFAQSFWDLRDYTEKKAMIYFVLENNKLQDPFYEQVYVPLFVQIGKEKRDFITTTPDTRKKPDKFFRIESQLEPINRQGKLVFNIKEQNNPHMMRMEEQFKAVEPTLSSHVDGPDSVEGGKFFIDEKFRLACPPIVGKRDAFISNNKRY